MLIMPPSALDWNLSVARCRRPHFAAAAAAGAGAAVGQRHQLVVGRQLGRLDRRLPLDPRVALVGEVALLLLHALLEALVEELLLEVVHLAARQVGDDAHVVRGRRRWRCWSRRS
jgi:hypothetical protein